MTDEASARDEICRRGESLYRRGYTVGSAGNISARIDDGYLMTPTDACLGTLEPNDLTKLDRAGERVSGATPSKTFALHRAVYDANAAVNGIVHTHSTHLVALSLAGVWRTSDVLPPITPYYVMKVGHVPLVRITVPATRASRTSCASWHPRYAASCWNASGPSSGRRPCRVPLSRSKSSKRRRLLPKRHSKNCAQHSAHDGRGRDGSDARITRDAGAFLGRKTRLS